MGEYVSSFWGTGSQNYSEVWPDRAQSRMHGTPCRSAATSAEHHRQVGSEGGGALRGVAFSTGCKPVPRCAPRRCVSRSAFGGMLRASRRTPDYLAASRSLMKAPK